MAFRMPHPVIIGNGVYHLNVRVPRDVAARVVNTRITLPVDGEDRPVGIRDKVILSLRTKDPREAKERFAQANAALATHWQSVRAGPAPLTHKQAVAVAGEFYRRQVADQEGGGGLTPEDLKAEADERRADREGLRLSQQFMHLDLPELSDEKADRVLDDMAAWRDAAAVPNASVADGHRDGPSASEGHAPRIGDGGAGGPSITPADVSDEELRIASLIHKPHGPAALAFRNRADLDAHGASITYDAALERLFGESADGLCRRLGLNVDGPSRARLLREIGEAYRQSEAKMLRNLKGDYSPDPQADRFPKLEPVAAAKAAQVGPEGIESAADLYRRWSARQDGKRSPATVRRYGPSLLSLDAFVEGRDWRTLTSDDVFAWATRRHEEDGVTPETVNRNDLVAVSSVLGWATAANGRKRPELNPAAGVRVEPSKRIVAREKFFRVDEIGAILRLARSVAPDPRHPRASASRRWAPWLCAYSGARVQETLWLTKADVRVEGGIPVMCFPKSKTGHARMVPIHEALIEEGFLNFVKAAPGGWLFVGDNPPKEGATRTQQEMRAAELAQWVRTGVRLDAGVNPNHGWRHTFITYAESRIARRFLNRITGHNMSDVSGRYVGALMPALAAEMAKFPRYAV